MLTSEHLNKEIAKVETLLKTEELEQKDPKTFINLKCLTLILKLLHSIRTNQTLMMEKMGVAKLKPVTPINTNKETNV